MTSSKTLLSTALVAVAFGAGASTASAAALSPDAAMRLGVRQFAKYGIKGHAAKASKISVDCKPLGKIGKTTGCSGTFRLTLNGKSVDYTLTKKAGIFHNSPHSLEYHVAAKAPKGKGKLPASIGTFAGFYQG